MIRGADAAVFPLPPHVAGRLLRAAAARIRARVAGAHADVDADAGARAVKVAAGAGADAAGRAVPEGSFRPEARPGPEHGAGPEYGTLAAATIGPAVARAGRRVLTVGYLRCALGR
jgi:hypothetical protein